MGSLRFLHSFRKFMLVVMMSLALQACIIGSSPTYDLPYSYDDAAPPMWKLGWQHGCKSGLTVYGSNVYRNIYKFTQDITKMKDNTYYKAWMDSFNYCRHYINKYLSGDSRTYEETPALFSSTSFSIAGGDKRDNRSLTATGLFGGEKTRKGLFGDMFDVKAPGHGSTGWGNSVEKCDWLNRCGKDKPADWHF